LHRGMDRASHARFRRQALILTLTGPVLFEQPHDLPTPHVYGPYIQNVTINGRPVQGHEGGELSFLRSGKRSCRIRRRRTGGRQKVELPLQT
jgi:hypothetical protein